ncbi:hypothetical protein [Chitinophaga pinensis]|uniref:Uncharacterized protein n=1 Tax=Chitinophaga pinensis (strain ATCC 43595 / DSM 2588 / LMG 13176 / NBRC 15968 / NCIMB 11800 / UQM 2034) TaxID=485918 RepID=A0A979G7G8_CHIPD|nr:hypothetical protein [Chitinophaga pinensis]ACU62042.1 hypothetical protein Cpin_4601 [Chitinophaga pinensis DSM 2588]
MHRTQKRVYVTSDNGVESGAIPTIFLKLLNINEDALHAEIVKVAYPIQQVAEAIYNSDIPDFYGDFLLR